MTDTNDMIERVRQVIFDVGEHVGCMITDEEGAQFARAAIKAMRAPTDDMCMAHVYRAWDEWTAYDLFRAMIDAALADKELASDD